MPVLLRTMADRADGYDHWVAIPPAATALEPARRRAGVGAALEAAFDAVVPECLALGRALGGAPSAALAHTPACAVNASDLAQMMAWTRLVDGWAAESCTTLVVCDDPWMFRHLRGRPGVEAGAAPPLLFATARLWLRGIAARCVAALRMAHAALVARDRPAGGAWILCYGHPSSDADGADAYFGDLMHRLPGIRRMLHADGTPHRAAALKSASLHAWGCPLFALGLPFARWRGAASGSHAWLVRRAMAREGGTGQAAAIRWQIHCQRRWLRIGRPAVVAWPWENHAWERDFARAARAAGVRTVGYQHSVVGRQMLNYSPTSNPDGAASLPDAILCSGAATREQLLAFGHDADRLAIGGAFRYPAPVAPPRLDKGAPVFVALPFDGPVAAQMVAACRAVAQATARRFLLKPHPMTPHYFDESAQVSHTTKRLDEQEAVSAVLFAATTVGLESVLMGIPALRFRPADRVSIDIVPTGMPIGVTDAEALADRLENVTKPAAMPRESVFSAVDPELWKRHLQGEDTVHDQ